jgi:hypothetical protein
VQSLKFYTAYLNNVRALILLYNNVIYKENFIVLPGDEIVEKKHKNIKHLIAMERNEDLSRRDVRSFPGLGPCNFKIDFSKLNPEQYGQPASPESGSADKEEVKNEVNSEV